MIVGSFINGKWEYINLKEYLSVEKDDKIGVINPNTSNLVFPLMKKSEFYQTYAIFYDKNDLAPYKKDGKFGFVRYEQ